MKLLLFATILSVNSACFGNPFSAIHLNSKSTPYVIQMMLTHLKDSPVSVPSTHQIIKDMNEINENLIYLDHVNRTFLTTSEVYKSFLNFNIDFITFDRRISKVQIMNITNKLERYKKVYTSFSYFLIDSVLKDFYPFTSDDFLERYSKRSTFETKDISRNKELKKKIKYSGPWINAIGFLTPERFNKFLIEVIENLIHNLAIQSRIFKLHNKINKSTQYPVLFENLPTDSSKQYSILQNEQGALEALPSTSKSEAINSLKVLDSNNNSSPSEQINKLINKIP